MRRFYLIPLIVSLCAGLTAEGQSAVDERVARSAQNLGQLGTQLDRIIGIEVLIADEGASPLTQWGQLLIRFVDDDQDPGNDFVVNFTATLSQPNGLPSSPQTPPSSAIDQGLAIFSQKYHRLAAVASAAVNGLNLLALTLGWNEFVELYKEGPQRPIERLIFPTTPQLRERIYQIIVEISSDPAAQYKLLSRNCTGNFIDLIQKTGFMMAFEPALPMPKEAPDYLLQSGLNPWPNEQLAQPFVPEARPAILYELCRTKLCRAQQIEAARGLWGDEFLRTHLMRLEIAEKEYVLYEMRPKLGKQGIGTIAESQVFAFLNLVAELRRTLGR